jgi:hypothetical protein
MLSIYTYMYSIYVYIYIYIYIFIYIYMYTAGTMEPTWESPAALRLLRKIPAFLNFQVVIQDYGVKPFVRV